VSCCAGYHSIAQRFFEEKGFKHVALLTADGALEAAPAMGCADIILDLVSTGRRVELGHNTTVHLSGTTALVVSTHIALKC
jgi:ATP phosphoribosyltransferase